jgi:hypothetical protein
MSSSGTELHLLEAAVEAFEVEGAGKIGVQGEKLPDWLEQNHDFHARIKLT